MNLNGCLSQLNRVTYGVPQGSVLGPTLFSVYMNDLSLIFSLLQIRMYADDTVIFSDLDCMNCSEAKIDQINSNCKLSVSLDFVSSNRYLGIKLNCNLLFNAHLENVISIKA